MRPSSTPSTKILPLLGFSSRMRSLTRVDLPAPDGPTRNRKSPSGTTRLMSRRASVPVGYVLKTCWKLITGRVSKSGVRTIRCDSCCDVPRQRARVARSGDVYRMPPEAPNPSESANHGGLTGQPGVACDRSILAQSPAQPALDERVYVPVQHSLGVAHLKPRPHVLDQGVRLKHVVPDLRPELGRHDLAPDLVEPGGRLLLLALKKASLEHLHRHLAVLH